MTYIQAARVSRSDPRDYDFVLLCSSGGKDGFAALGTLLDAGFERSQIELHHNLVGGHDGPPFMDWPSGEGYCEAVARALDLPIYFSWRDGGFRREMMRRDAPTAPVFFQTPGGRLETAGGKGRSGAAGRTPRRRWPTSGSRMSPRRRASPGHGRRTSIPTRLCAAAGCRSLITSAWTPVRFRTCCAPCTTRP